jgi:hypothetical protein
MIDYIAAVLELPPALVSAMFVVWMVIVGSSVIVYHDARRHHIGPTLGLRAATPGAIAALIVWLPAFALPVYVWRRKKLIERAVEHPSNRSGFISYVVWLVLYTALFPILIML